MGNDLKKVGLVFKADGSVDFVKSLQLVNSTLKENYQQFQLTQTLWDKNTKTSEKLASKMNYLNDAIDIQKDKTRVLITELEELEKAEYKDETAIQKKKAALTQAEAELGRYEKQLKNVNDKIKLGTADLEDFASKLDKTGDKLTKAGKKMSVFSAGFGTAVGLSVKSAIDFESAFAGVEKTVNATEEELNALKKGIRDMAKEIPTSTTEISKVAEAAGQLGIQTDSILSFTRTMVDLGETTNLSAEEAATTLARFANVTKMSQKDFDKLGATIVELGNNFATTEKEISDMGMNLASAGTQVGMSQSDILALATALSSVGLEAEAGGTAFSKVMIEMQLAAETGSDKLNDFAKVAGTSADEFVKAFKDDATGALMSFIDGLSKSGEQGNSAIKVLDDMGIKEVRLRNALLSSANASDIFSEAIETGSDAWEDNTALTEEAQKRYETAEANMEIFKNTLNDLGITFGEIVLPYVTKFIDKLKGVIEWFDKLSPTMKNTILIIGGIIAAIGPFLLIAGSIIKVVSGIISVITFLIANPLVLIIGAIVAVIAIFVLFGDKIKAVMDNVFNWITGIFDKIKGFFEGSIFLGMFAGVIQNFENILEAVKRIFGGIIDLVKGIFTGDWKRAWEGVKNIFGGIFDGLYAIAVSPLNLIIGALNGLISGVNLVIKGLNKIKLPDWEILGSLAGKGINISTIGKIPYLAKGGELLEGMAMVAEAGPELLLQQGNRTKVVPLTESGGPNQTELIDYKKMAQAFMLALTNTKFTVDDDGFARIVKDELLKVV
ncbi:MAG: phage tail tape measure protein [Bacilli bacterium]|nr:phage tail tape measure protein [Bacilli bacterium]